MALFITFEGGEGSGKTLQARVLYRKLSQLAIPVLLTHEPGGTPLGRKLARWLKWTQDIGISPLTELLMFNASRAQLVKEVILPNLKGEKVVICDRYVDSTTAYQSYGRGLDPEMVKAISNIATEKLKPNLTILLDIPVEEGLARKESRKYDRFEQENINFHRRVREGYLKIAANDPQRWLVIDASQSKEKIARVIWQKVGRLISSQGA
ncbi:dTMP kinase [Chloroflexota bacterium]